MTFDKNAYYREYFKEQRARIVEAKKELGGKCVECGTTEKLQFHHLPNEEKLFGIGSSDSRSDASFWNEVAKCVLLCISCHATLSHTTMGFVHGTVNAYQHYMCRCAECREAYRLWKKEHKTLKEKYDELALKELRKFLERPI